MKGLHFYITIGKWATPKVQRLKSFRAVRICLGYIAIQLGGVCIEDRWREWIVLLKKAIDRKERSDLDKLRSVTPDSKNVL